MNHQPKQANKMTIKQLFMNSRGNVEIHNVPDFSSATPDGFIKVRTKASLISSGTDRALIHSAGSGSLINKVRSNPSLIQKVFNTVIVEGPNATVRAVNSKLKDLIPLGYSIAGEVLDVGKNVTEFKAGDHVACAGVGYANHAEINLVPVNLSVGLSKNVPFEDGCFVALGAIAQQGIRQSKATFGETLLIVGAGLLGNLAAIQSSNAGIKTMVVDVDKNRTDFLSSKTGIKAISTNDPLLEKTILEFTDGNGFDSAVITAGSSDEGAFNTSMAYLSDRGIITFIGIAGLPSNSAPIISKEVEIHSSRSYGPGRYDPRYEERGLDYPINYVRWTEKRIMKNFIDLLAEKKICVRHMYSSCFEFSKAKQAYTQLNSKGQSKDLAIILAYPGSAKVQVKSAQTTEIGLSKPKNQTQRDPNNLGLWGLGAFSKQTIIPEIQKNRFFNLKALGSSSGANTYNTSRTIKNVENFTDFQQMLSSDISSVIIANRHFEHADLACEALKAGCNVWLEKPIAIDEDQFMKVYSTAKLSTGKLMIGHNRKHSKFCTEMRKFIGDNSKRTTVVYRVCPGQLSKSHWMHDKQIGGGRLVSEISHFTDTLIFLMNDKPKTISANFVGENMEGIVAQILFNEGGTAQLSYLPEGSNSIGKEYIEIHCGSSSMQCFDYKELSCDGKKIAKDRVPNKGYSEQLVHFSQIIRDQFATPNKFFNLEMQASKLMFDIIQSAQKNGAPIEFVWVDEC